MANISQITIPVTTDGVTSNVTYDIKDATARAAIEAVGNSVYWAGVTTTALTDGETTADITVGGTTVTPLTGAMVQYDGEEFVWNGTSWQSVGKNNFGALAFKSNATADYTPAGTVSQPTATISNSTTTTVKSIATVGTLPSMTVSGETLTFTPGTLPSIGENTTVVTAVGDITISQPTFEGTQASIVVK